MPASSPERSTVSLRAAPGATVAAPLADERCRSMVLASAEALAERSGVRLVSLEHDVTGLTATIEGPMVVAMGFAAELRRITESWHRKKYGAPLWEDPA